MSYSHENKKNCVKAYSCIKCIRRLNFSERHKALLEKVWRMKCFAGSVISIWWEYLSKSQFMTFSYFHIRAILMCLIKMLGESKFSITSSTKSALTSDLFKSTALEFWFDRSRERVLVLELTLWSHFVDIQGQDFPRLASLTKVLLSLKISKTLLKSYIIQTVHLSWGWKVSITGWECQEMKVLRFGFQSFT